MDKKKEIEEMVEIARKYSENFANTPYYKGVKTDMEAIYEAGYRKADGVRKETIEEIFRELFCAVKEVGDFIITPSDIIERAQMYGITIEEVDE